MNGRFFSENSYHRRLCKFTFRDKSKREFVRISISSKIEKNKFSFLFATCYRTCARIATYYRNVLARLKRDLTIGRTETAIRADLTQIGKLLIS
jgi:hypothetical protein